jgi:hypothetical protein
VGILVGLAGCFLFSGCSWNKGTGPAYDETSGTYVLDEFDESPLPRTIDSSSGCANAITYGRLDLVPQVGETAPVYSLAVEMRASCKSFEQQPIPESFTVDAGRWSTNGEVVSLSSSNSAGKRVASVAAANNQMLLSVSWGGRKYLWRKVREREAPFGVVSVSTVDLEGRPVDGVIVEGEAPDGLITRGTTNNGRSFRMQSAPGEFFVRLVAPEGWLRVSSAPALNGQVDTGGVTQLTIVFRRT